MRKRGKEKDAQEWFGMELVHNDEVIGRLIEVDSDEPWLQCRFIARPGFEKVKKLFDDELKVLESEEWNAAYQKIMELKLKLRPHPFQENIDEPIEEFILHIDGKKAWYRY